MARFPRPVMNVGRGLPVPRDWGDMTTKKDKNIPTINVSITGNVDGNITIGDENTAAIERGSTLAPYGGTAGTRPDPRLLPGKTAAKINSRCKSRIQLCQTICDLS